MTSHRLRDAGLSLFAVVLVAAVVGTYYRLIWPDLSDFVRSIDGMAGSAGDCGHVGCDFINVFYPMGTRLAVDVEPVPGYYYPAFFALLLKAVSHLSSEHGLLAWQILQIVAALLLFLVPMDEFAESDPLTIGFYSLVFLTSVPLLHNFKWGQVSTLVTTLMLGSFVAYRRGAIRWSAVLLAIGAAIKYYPALIGIYFVLKREYKLLIISAGVFVTLYFLIPVMSMGVRDYLTFERGGLASLRDAAWIHANDNSQFVSHVLVRRIGLLRSYGEHSLLLRVIRFGTVALSAAAIIKLVGRRNINEAFSALVLMFLTLPFVLETSWPHYFVYLPFAQVAVFLEGRKRSPAVRLAMTTAGLLSVFLSSVIAMQGVGGWIPYSAGGWLFVSNCALLVAWYVLTFSASPATPELVTR